MFNTSHVFPFKVFSDMIKFLKNEKPYTPLPLQLKFEENYV